jgi:hypothetical protein
MSLHFLSIYDHYNKLEDYHFKKCEKCILQRQAIIADTTVHQPNHFETNKVEDKGK